MAKYAQLHLEWDSYEPPSEFNVFGLDAVSEVPGLPTLEWKTKATDAWQWLRDHGFEPKSWRRSGRRIPKQGYVRPITITFSKEA